MTIKAKTQFKLELQIKEYGDIELVLHDAKEVEFVIWSPNFDDHHVRFKLTIDDFLAAAEMIKKALETGYMRKS